MTKVYFILMFILLGIIGIILTSSRKSPDFNKNVLINYYGGTGCCETSSGCASGRTVSEEFCLQELNGQWELNKICNTQSGDCY